MKSPIFIAHRGAWSPGRRENTAAAIERAVGSGRFAYIELDIRRTRSDDTGEPTIVIFHDDHLDRLYDTYNIPYKKRHRLGQSISNLSIDIIRNEEIEITTLAEAMRAADGHPLNLDVKDPEVVDQMIDVINDMINKYPEWSYEKIVVSSFDWKILADIQAKEPRIGLAMLYGWRNLPKPFAGTYKKLEARWISFSTALCLIMSPVAAIHKIPNRNVFVVNNKFLVKILSFIGVTGFFTDSIKLPDMLD